MNKFHFTNQQARLFMLLKQGLIGDYRLKGKNGVCEYIRQAGCIQFDPVDRCGKNAELVLQSRVKGFTKDILRQLLYEDRKLVDYFDKNMSIFCAEDWKYFRRIREQHCKQGRNRETIDRVKNRVMDEIREKKVVCSKDIDLPQIVDWSWKATTLSRAVLETLYFRGDLAVHHKKGMIKYYTPADSVFSMDILNAFDPNPTDEDFLAWRIRRRIGSVGLLWNKSSDAWLGIDGLKSKQRTEIFEKLTAAGKITPCTAEGITDTLYFLKEDLPLAETAVAQNINPETHIFETSQLYENRLEFLAPLDNILWDRNLIRKLFGFDYKWEVYTPAAKRKYGNYVLPVLYGMEFAGRIECSADRKTGRLQIINFWPENGFHQDCTFRRDLEKRINSFAQFNQCTEIVYENDTARFIVPQ